MLKTTYSYKQLIKKLKTFNGIKTLKDNLLISERKMQIKSNWNFAVRRCRLHKVYIHCKQRKQSFGENQLKNGEDRKVVLYLSLRLLNLLATNVMKKLKPWINYNALREFII